MHFYCFSTLHCILLKTFKLVNHNNNSSHIQLCLNNRCTCGQLSPTLLILLCSTCFLLSFLSTPNIFMENLSHRCEQRFYNHLRVKFVAPAEECSRKQSTLVHKLPWQTSVHNKCHKTSYICVQSDIIQHLVFGSFLQLVDIMLNVKDCVFHMIRVSIKPFFGHCMVLRNRLKDNFYRVYLLLYYSDLRLMDYMRFKPVHIYEILILVGCVFLEICDMEVLSIVLLY